MVENLFKKNPLQDLLSSLNAVISTNDSTQFITGQVIYTYKFQLKTTIKFVQVSSMVENKGHIGCHYVQWTYKSTHMKKASSWQISGYFRTQGGSLLVSVDKIFGIIDIMLYAFGQEDIIKVRYPWKILVLFPLPKKCAAFYPKLCILNFPALGHCSVVRVSQL